MKFETWVSGQIEVLKASNKKLNVEIKEIKSELKHLESVIRNADDKMKVAAEISKLEYKLHQLKADKKQNTYELENYKRFHKCKPERLKTGAVIQTKLLEEMLKKLKGPWEIEFFQYRDGLEMKYWNPLTKVNGSFKFMNLPLDVPDDIELRTFEEGEVLNECLIN